MVRAQRRAALIGSLSLVLAGCGNVEGDVLTSAGSTRHEESPVATRLEGVTCGGARWDSRERIVGAGFDGLALVLMTADGRYRTAHTFPEVSGSTIVQQGSRLTTEDGAVTASGYGSDRLGYIVGGETVRLDAQGTLVWRLDGVASVASDEGMGTTANGKPVIVHADGQVLPVPVPEYDSFTFIGPPDADGWMTARWTVYRDMTTIDHYGAVNLDGVRYREDEAPPYNPPWQVAGDWTLHTEGNIPEVLEQRPSGWTERVDLEALAPRRALEGAFCNLPTLLADGRIGFGMRDDSKAEYLVREPHTSLWDPVGTPMRNVNSILGQRIGSTWVLTGTTGYDTYCPKFEPFPEDDAIPAGEVLELVPDGQSPVVFTAESEYALPNAVLHPSGTCAYVETTEGMRTSSLYELDTGRVMDTAPLTTFTWLP